MSLTDVQLQELNRTLSRIEKVLKPPSGDNRIWTPDESCKPFLWQGWGVGANTEMGSFSFPSNHVGIIAKYAGAYAAVSSSKAAKRIIITDSPINFSVSSPPGLSLTGAIQNVSEGTTDVRGFLVNGMAVAGDNAPTPQIECRVILRGGIIYSVWGAGGGTGYVTATFSGWVFKEK